jgi:hypothetical protein
MHVSESICRAYKDKASSKTSAASTQLSQQFDDEHVKRKKSEQIEAEFKIMKQRFQVNTGNN